MVSSIPLLEYESNKMVRQAEMWRALMNNWDRAQELIKVSIESTGSAAEKMQTYMGGLEAKVNAFKTAWGQLIYNQDTVKFFASIVDGGTKLLEILQQIISNGLVQFIAKIAAAETAFLGFSRAIELIKASKLVVGIKDLITQFTTLAVAASTTGTTVAASAAAGSAAVVAAETTVTASTITLSGAISALTGVMLTNPLFLGAVAVAGIVAIVAAVDAFTESTAEAKARMTELKAELSSTKTELSDTEKSLSDIKDRMAEIKSQGELTISDEAELENLKKESAELERQIFLLKEKKEAQGKELYNKAEKTYDSTMPSMEINADKITKAYERLNKELEYKTELEWKDSAGINNLIGLYTALESIQERNGTLTEKQAEWYELAGNKLLEYAGDADELIKSLEDSGVKSEKANQMVAELTRTFETVQKFVDPATYQLSQFNEALASIEVDGTIEKLRELNEVGMLDESVIENIQAFKDVMERTGMSASDILAEFKQRFAEVAEAEEEVVDKTEDLEASIKDFTDAMDGFANATSTVKDIQKELAETGQLSVDSLKQIADLYPQMADSLYEYVAGLTTEEEIMSRLTELYEQDRENYATVIRDKLGDSEQFYNSLLEANDGLVEKFNETYQVDLSNCKTYNEAKLQIETEAKTLLLKLNYDFENELLRMYGEESVQYQEYLNAKQKGDAELLKWLLEHWAEYFGNTATTFKDLSDLAAASAGDIASAFQAVGVIGEVVANAINNARVSAALAAMENDINRLSGAAMELNTISLAPISTEFDSLASSIGNTTSAAKQAENAMKTLVDSVVKMLKQNAKNRKGVIKDRIADAKKAYDAEKNALKKEYDERKNALKKENDQRKRALEDQKKIRDRALEDEYKAMKRAWEDEYKARKDAIDKNYDALKDSVEKEKKTVIDGIQKQIDAYEKLIDAKMKALDRESEEHDYQAEVAEKLKDISALQERITELQNDVSPEGTKKRLQLEQELAEFFGHLHSNMYL